jgi:hypothetical protein
MRRLNFIEWLGDEGVGRGDEAVAVEHPNEAGECGGVLDLVFGLGEEPTENAHFCAEDAVADHG